MSIGYQLRRGTRWKTTFSLLVASITFHGWALCLLILIARTYPLGNGGFGNQNTEVLSVLLLPGKGDPGHGFDTKVFGSDSTGPLELDTSTNSDGTSAKRKLIAVAETDPQSVFTHEQIDPLTKPVTQTVALHSSENRVDPATSKEDVSDGSVTDVDGDSEQGNDGATGEPSDGHSSGSQAKGGKAGSGQTTFFGIAAPAKRIAYVIDASESMRNHKAMETAKRELLNSLNDLSPTSQFQIIFFNQTNYRIDLNGKPPKLHLASPTNLRHARQLIGGIDPCCGTDRMAALTEALNLKPDVIYLLTDADPPELSAQDLWEIQRKNQRKTAIHIVEFAVSADLGRDTFLRKLARQNRGQHVYRNLKRPTP